MMYMTELGCILDSVLNCDLNFIELNHRFTYVYIIDERFFVHSIQQGVHYKILNINHDRSTW